MRHGTMITLCLICLLLTLASARAQEHGVSLDHVDGYTGTQGVGDDSIGVGEITMWLRVTSNGSPNCYFCPSFTFTVYSPDGALWESTLLELTGPCADGRFPIQYWPNPGYVSGSDTDYVAVALSTMFGPGIGEGFDDLCSKITIYPQSISDGLTMCLDTAEFRQEFPWRWEGFGAQCEPEFEGVMPDWDGLHCFTITAVDCCGRYTGGYTGNVDYDNAGNRNLADISKLVDRVYITKAALACEPEGNVNGDVESRINLADISRLIDHVYVTKQETAPCQ